MWREQGSPIPASLCSPHGAPPDKVGLVPFVDHRQDNAHGDEGHAKVAAEGATQAPTHRPGAIVVVPVVVATTATSTDCCTPSRAGGGAAGKGPPNKCGKQLKKQPEPVAPAAMLAIHDLVNMHFLPWSCAPHDHTNSAHTQEDVLAAYKRRTWTGRWRSWLPKRRIEKQQSSTGRCLGQ